MKNEIKTYIMVWINEEEKWYHFREEFDENQFPDGYCHWEILVKNGIIIEDSWKTENVGKMFDKAYNKKLWGGVDNIKTLKYVGVEFDRFFNYGFGCESKICKDCCIENNIDSRMLKKVEEGYDVKCGVYGCLNYSEYHINFFEVEEQEDEEHEDVKNEKDECSKDLRRADVVMAIESAKNGETGGISHLEHISEQASFSVYVLPEWLTIDTYIDYHLSYHLSYHEEFMNYYEAYDLPDHYLEHRTKFENSSKRVKVSWENNGRTENSVECSLDGKSDSIVDMIMKDFECYKNAIKKGEF